MNSLAFPEWTENKKKRGLDPLGMRNSSVDLYQRLLPGIGNVTTRMRYYGLYAWLAWIFANKIGSTDPERWRIFIRRAEALYALISIEVGNEKGMAGVEWAQKKLTSQLEGIINFSDATDRGGTENYFVQAWGVYGLAYKSQLMEIGILDESLEHETPIVSKISGEPLVEALSQEIGDVLAIFFNFVESGRVPRGDLKSMSSLLPSAIGPDSKERDLYEKILLGHIDPDRTGSKNRSAILLHILSVAKYLKGLPRQDEVRWALYAGHGKNKEDFLLKNETLQRSQEAWKIYQANDLLHYSYATILRYALDLLHDYPDGLRLPALISEAMAGITGLTGDKYKTWKSFAEEIGVSDNPWSADDASGELKYLRMIDVASKEGRIVGPETALTALRLLAMLHNRMRSEFSLEVLKQLFGRLNSVAFSSLLTEYQFLEEISNTGIQTMLSRFIEERIIKRHLWIASKKFLYHADYTFLMEVENGRIKLRDTDRPVLTNPRLSPAITFLKDIHLMDEHGLTNRGLKVCEAA